jgi:hypothetical protein
MKTALFLSLCLLTMHAHAFTLSNSAAASFGKGTISVDVAAHNCNNIGPSNDQLLGIIRDAVDQYWNSVPTSSLRMEAGGLRTVSSLFQTDRICSNSGTDNTCTPNPSVNVDYGILVSCNTSTDNFPNNSVLAVTVPNNIGGRTIHGALILLNDRSDNQFQNKSHDEQVAILAHEIGHAIGLGHSPVEDSLMYYRSVPTRRSLGWDDIDGVTYLYPTEQPLHGCGTIGGPEDGKGTWTGLFVGFSLMLLTSRLRFPRLRRAHAGA